MTTGYAAFQAALRGTAGTGTEAVYDLRLAQYARGWAAYRESLYLRGLTAAEQAIGDTTLYGNLRALYLLTADVVDFYTAHVYPGGFPEDGDLSDAAFLAAMPIRGDDRQLLAIAQLWQWSSWGRASLRWQTWGNAMGDAPLQVVDDVEGGAVRIDPLRPDYVKAIELSAAGHVRFVRIEYQVFDRAANAAYTYAREMDNEKIRTFKDGSAFAYSDAGAVYDNPYGFVPLAWAKPRDTGETPGATLFRGWRLMDEVNSAASRLSDYIRDTADAPKGLGNAGEVELINVKGAPESDPAKRRMKLLRFAQDVTEIDLSGSLDISDAREVLNDLHERLRDANSEPFIYRKALDKGDSSGVALRRALEPVQAAVWRVATSYDAALISAQRMALAIGGDRYRAREGGWAQRTSQQQAFAPFNLDSWNRGDLSFSFKRRDMVEDSKLEIAQQQATQAQAYSVLRVPEALAWEDVLGFDEQRVADAVTAQSAQELRSFLGANSDVATGGAL